MQCVFDSQFSGQKDYPLRQGCFCLRQRSRAWPLESFKLPPAELDLSILPLNIEQLMGGNRRAPKNSK